MSCEQQVSGQAQDFTGYCDCGYPLYRNTADGPQCTHCKQMCGYHLAYCRDLCPPWDMLATAEGKR